MGAASELAPLIVFFLASMVGFVLAVIVPHLVSDWRYRRLTDRIKDAEYKQVLARRWICRGHGGELCIYHHMPPPDMTIVDLGILTEWEAHQILKSRTKLESMSPEERAYPYISQGNGNAIRIARLTWRNPWRAFP